MVPRAIYGSLKTIGRTIMGTYRDFAVTIAEKAGELLKERLHEKHHIDFKGEIDIVTDVDRMSEELLLSLITRAYPHHDVLTEESLGRQSGARQRWIIDPIDGTTNYAHGFPFFCVSVALEEEGQITVGVVYNPILQEMFVAERGKGAFWNGRRISVSEKGTLAKGFLATGFPYDIGHDPNNNINYFSGMALKSLAIRRAGSAAMDLAYVAAGRFDGFWELKLHPWDTAAGWLLVEEAGGRVTDISGNDYFLLAGSILATNGVLHDEMIQALGTINPLDERLC